MKSTIVYLLGHYGVGKLTIAKALHAQSGAVIFDNHLANNAIFSLVRADGKTPLPKRVWDLIWTIREQMVTAIDELAPRDTSYVLTNALMEDDARDRASFEQIESLAGRRGSLFVPVMLTASDAAFDTRIPSPEREARLKHTDAASARGVRDRRRILAVDHPHRLDLDTTDLPPEQAARIILDHAERLAAR